MSQDIVYNAFLVGANWADPKNIWHDASEEPNGDKWEILCVDEFDLFWVVRRANVLGLYINWDDYTVIEGVKMWAYISDLLPKQFGNPKQVKGGEI